MTKKLLLIEDSLSIQALVTTVFEHEDVDIIATDNALDGLQKAQMLVPDIVLADASLPEMDGFQLCQHIRQTSSGQHLPVVLLTSNFAAYDQAKGDLAGVTAHLGKPFAAHTLIDLVKRYVPVVRRLGSSPTVTLSTSPLAVLPTVKDASALHHAAVDSPSRPHADVTQDRLDIGKEPVLTESALAPPSLETKQPQTAVASSLPELSPYAHDLPLESSPITSQVRQVAAAHNEATARSTQEIYHTLGQRFEQILRETVAAHLPDIVAQIMPQMLATARAMAAERMPALLAEFLQQEIEKLKHAVEQEPDHD